MKQTQLARARWPGYVLMDLCRADVFGVGYSYNCFVTLHTASRNWKFLLLKGWPRSDGWSSALELSLSLREALVSSVPERKAAKMTS